MRIAGDARFRASQQQRGHQQRHDADLHRAGQPAWNTLLLRRQRRPWMSTTFLLIGLTTLACAVVVAVAWYSSSALLYQHYSTTTATSISSWFKWLLFSDPVTVLLRQRRKENPKPLRVFGPAASSVGPRNEQQEALLKRQQQEEEEHNNNNNKFSFHFYTREEQRNFLADFGTFCQRPFRNTKSKENGNSNNNVLLQQFGRLPEALGTELWKYCVLYTGLGNVYWEADNLTPLVSWDDVMILNNNKNNAQQQQVNRAIQIESSSSSSSTREDASSIQQLQLHHSFLQVAKPKSKVCANMMRLLATTESSYLDPIRLSELLGMYVTNDSRSKQEWQLLSARCLWTGGQQQQQQQQQVVVVVRGNSFTAATGADTDTTEVFVHSSPLQQQHEARSRLPMQCPMANGGHCCQVWLPEAPDSSWAAIMVAREPYLTLKKSPNDVMTDNSHPYRNTLDETELAMPVEDLAYIATIREVPTNTTPLTPFETPNFFDILVENNCLPEGRECFRCLKKEPTSTNKNNNNNDCLRCKQVCPCYCSALCQIRPPPKQVSAEWLVRLPRFRKAPNRHVPRIIHQTWYEPISQEKYPNMSRLIESFRSSGWEYNFYTDETAAQFISTHFPPQVREAYDAILPGAFKADLFRYSVLLIRGGVYADMDVMLESSLDAIIDESVGFLTAQDEPGMAAGQRSCLWNGFMASAPGHPFLLRTLENVVNNIRNRFTSVDYDDMLCPNPALSVSHTSDMLFTCGPCILGASINDVLKRHRQQSFEYGDIDLFETERLRNELGNDGGVDGTTTDGAEKATIVMEDPNDPRLAIPGRSVLLKQDKGDMGAHRFTHVDANIVVASTDLPDYDDRPKSLVHYSKTRERFGIYGFSINGISKLYADDVRANEEIRIRLDFE